MPVINSFPAVTGQFSGVTQLLSVVLVDVRVTQLLSVVLVDVDVTELHSVVLVNVDVT